MTDIVRVKLMDKAESIIKHIVTSIAVVWSINIVIAKLEELTNIVIALIILIILLIFVNLRQRKFIGDKTEQMATYNEKLEQKIDPNRTSSNLTMRGQTNPGDK